MTWYQEIKDTRLKYDNHYYDVLRDYYQIQISNPNSNQSNGEKKDQTVSISPSSPSIDVIIHLNDQSTDGHRPPPPLSSFSKCKFFSFFSKLNLFTIWNTHRSIDRSYLIDKFSTIKIKILTNKQTCIEGNKVFSKNHHHCLWP